METWKDCFPESIRAKYELHNFNHAAEILSQSYSDAFTDILDSLENLHILVGDIIAGGGSESNIPKKLSLLLRPKSWQEVKITGDLLVKLHYRNPSDEKECIINDFIGGHNIDYVKGKIALDMEWNSKDQTFDRDLYAFRNFYECGIIDCGVIITRSVELNAVFDRLGIKQKYGASTTWMGKLLPRIHSRRHGGCPLLVVGIKPACIVDMEDKNGDR